MGLSIWLSHLLLALIGYCWATSVLHRMLVGKMMKRLSGLPRNYFKELPLLLTLNLFSEGPSEINQFSIRQNKEGNFNLHQLITNLAFNSLPVVLMIALFAVGALYFNFAFLIVSGFVVWLWEKSFRPSTPVAFVFFGFGLWGVSLERAMQQASTLMASAMDYSFLFYLSSKHWGVIIAVLLVVAVANAFVRRWPLFLMMGLLLGVMGLASMPIATTLFTGAWLGQLAADAWPHKRANLKSLYLIRALLGLSGVIAGWVWSWFGSAATVSVFEAQGIYDQLILGLGLCILTEIFVSSLFFHFYFARRAKSLS